MKRPSEDDGDQQSSSPDGKVEAFLSEFLKRHPRFFVYLTAAIVVLIAIALLIAKFTS